MHMLTRRLIAASAAACAVTVALAGCTPPDQRPTPTSIPTTQNSPAFASDQDALKAATDAYAAYLKMSDTIFSQGGENPERITPFVSKSMAVREMSGYKDFAERRWRSTGSSEFDHVKVQRFGAGERVPISLYLCLDVSAVDVLEAAEDISAESVDAVDDTDTTV